ncbi:putative phage abortive infection protein [Acinetobacter sp. ULE_I010]|uniref:putative phage abortive infection protein n=1 Tax=Acinetobacter sp. ULE_I010 TaxID=3373065 RepID=UPI003AF4777E
MSQEEKKNKDIDAIDQDISFHRVMVFLIIIAVGFFYLIMKEVNVSEKAQHWGTVGDFFGGILNPIFGLFAFYWLTYSVRLQIKELKETRLELSKAATAQEESAKYQKEIALLDKENVNTQKEILDLQRNTFEGQQQTAIAQQEQIALQNFESLFFQLLKTKTDATNDILVGAKGTLINFCKFVEKTKGPVPTVSIEKIDNMIKDRVQGKESIKDHIIIFKSNVVKSWEEFYTKAFLDYAGSYFRVSYQTVKLIDNNQVLKVFEKIENKEYSRKQKEYFDIFRATFTQYELEAFFFNCLSKYGNGPFKELLEKYGMFEPLLIDTDRSNERFHALTRYAYMYNSSIFEKNELWKEYFKDIDILKKIDPEQMRNYFFILLKYKFINYAIEGNSYNFYDEKFKSLHWDTFLNEYIVLSENYNKDNLKDKIEKNINSEESSISSDKLKIEEYKLKEKIESHTEEEHEERINKEISYYEERIVISKAKINELKQIINLDIIFLFLDYGIRPEEFFQYFKLK